MKILIKIILPICLILAGTAGFRYYQSKEVKVGRTPPKKQVSLVDVVSVSLGTHKTGIRVLGTVGPSRTAVLKSRVAGEVVWISPALVEGGLVSKGEILLRLDDADYRLEVSKAEASLSKTLADLEIEKGQQQIAKEELRLISKVSPQGMGPTDLALRKPQLAQAKAALSGAMTDLEKAALNLKRTEITAPFNGLVLEKNVDLGSLAATQSTLATLAGTDTYQVEARVPLDRLAFLFVDKDKGSPARVRSPYNGHEWMGRVVRTTGRVTKESRMAGVIIEIPDPLGLKQENRGADLLLDDHVRVHITGKPIENVYILARPLLREDNRVWVYDSGRLGIRAVEIVWKEADQVFIRSGLNPGDRVITSDLPVPVEGMPLQLSPGEKS